MYKQVKVNAKMNKFGFLSMELSVLHYVNDFFSSSVLHFTVGSFAQLFLLMFRAQVIHSIIKNALTHRHEVTFSYTPTHIHTYLKNLGKHFKVHATKM